MIIEINSIYVNQCPWGVWTNDATQANACQQNSSNYGHRVILSRRNRFRILQHHQNSDESLKKNDRAETPAGWHTHLLNRQPMYADKAMAEACLMQVHNFNLRRGSLLARSQ